MMGPVESAVGLLRFLQLVSFKSFSKSIIKDIAVLSHLVRSETSGLGSNDYKQMKKIGVFKDKYFTYSAFFSGISSYPILYNVASHNDLLNSMKAKSYFIISAKSMDNINDRYQDLGGAEKSLYRYLKALRDGEVCLNEEDNVLAKSENVSLLLAQKTRNLLLDLEASMLDRFKVHVNELIEGQILSIKQNSSNSGTLTIKKYFEKVLEKNIGKVWFDLDRCFYEKNRGTRDMDELRGLDALGQGFDILFKAYGVYDDVADLEQDLKDGAANIVLIYGKEKAELKRVAGKSDSEIILQRIVDCGAAQDVIGVGDILYKKGLLCVEEARDYLPLVDFDALLYSAKVLREFSLRKFTKKWPSSYEPAKSLTENNDGGLSEMIQRLIIERS